MMAAAIQQFSPAPDNDPVVGQVLDGRYEIERLIGRGGVGVVYLARDRETGTDVVVKFLSQALMRNADAVARFGREAEKLAQTRHDNIVSMLGHGQEGGRIYLVMEYVRGHLLEDHLKAKGGRLRLREFVPIAAQILKGMGHAHSRQMMIRDIKPSNVMLCERKGRANFVKVLDFGLAKQLREEVEITGEHVIGTAGYLAPETLRGEPGDLRVDVYAAGVLFYFMLSGRLPFTGTTTASVLYQTVHESAPNLAGMLPQGHDVPAGLLALVHSCLAKNPDDRPDDANTIVERLIDSVSASLFRLPKAQAGPLPTSFGNTGLFKLLGQKSTDSSSTGSTPAASTTEMVAQVKGSKGIVLVALAALAIVAGGFATGLQFAGSDDEPVAQAPGVPVEVVREASPAPTPAQREVAAVEPARPSVVDSTAAMGEVKFRSAPPAMLQIDGKDIGLTPHTVALPLGPHRVRLHRRGYEPWESTVDVAAADNAGVAVELPRASRRARGKSKARHTVARDTPEPVPELEPELAEPTAAPESPLAVPTPDQAEPAAKPELIAEKPEATSAPAADALLSTKSARGRDLANELLPARTE